jgi:hypothetical protein
MKDRAFEKSPVKANALKGVKRILGALAAAIVAMVCLLLWQQQAQAATDDVPVPVEQVAEEAAEESAPEASEPGVTDRAKKAFGFLFHGDATDIVAEVNDELEQRLAAVAEQEAALAQREIDLREAEIAVAEEKDEARAYSDAIKAKHEALTACILQAIGGDK